MRPHPNAVFRSPLTLRVNGRKVASYPQNGLESMVCGAVTDLLSEVWAYIIMLFVIILKSYPALILQSLFSHIVLSRFH